jgi:hypothetical protein
MIYKSFAVMGALTLLSAALTPGSAPKELYGKSIIITWTEHRSQRQVDQTAAFTLLSAAAYGGSAPKELYGKSISEPWSQTSILRFEADQRTRSISQAVSSAHLHQHGGSPICADRSGRRSRWL